MASRVGFDRFDPSKLEEGTASVPWLSEVATKHNQFVCDLAECGPVLPLRLGTLFKSQSSLEAKVAQCNDRMFTFLHDLGDRREWAVKTYLDEALAETRLFDRRGVPTGIAAPPNATPTPAGMGTQYLAARRQHIDRRRQINAAARRQLATAEAQLLSLADCWCRLRCFRPP